MESEKEKEKRGRPKKYHTDEERKAAKALKDKARHSDYYQRHREERIAKAKAWRMKNGQKKPPAEREKAIAKRSAQAKMREVELEQERRAREPMTDKQRGKVLAGLPESVRMHVMALEELKKKAQTKSKTTEQ